MSDSSGAGATGVVAIVAIFLIVVGIFAFLFFSFGGAWFGGGAPSKIDVDVVPTVVPE